MFYFLSIFSHIFLFFYSGFFFHSIAIIVFVHLWYFIILYVFDHCKSIIQGFLYRLVLYWTFTMYCDTNEERAREEWNKMLPPHPLNRFAYYLNIIPLLLSTFFTTIVGFPLSSTVQTHWAFLQYCIQKCRLPSIFI